LNALHDRNHLDEPLVVLEPSSASQLKRKVVDVTVSMDDEETDTVQKLSLVISTSSPNKRPKTYTELESTVLTSSQFTYMLTITTEDEVQKRTCFFIAKIPLGHSSSGELVQVR
jgi:hypothetical protein